jgi:hypothetical protein
MRPRLGTSAARLALACPIGAGSLMGKERRAVEALEPSGLKPGSLSPLNRPIKGQRRCSFQQGRALEADRRRVRLSVRVEVERRAEKLSSLLAYACDLIIA